MDTKLKEIYQNPNDIGSYGGVERLYQSAKAQNVNVSRKQVAIFLRSHRGYTLHKPYRKHFTRNPTIVSGIDVQWQADLVDMQSLSKSNLGFKYILTVIDCFSKFAWAVPMKSKSSDQIINAFKTIFDTGRFPKKLQTDKGKEFLNKEFQNLLKQHNVHHFTTENETKAAIVERFNRTLKTRMWTYFSTNRTDEYIKVLNSLIESYNQSVHRSIGMKPVDVKKEDEEKLFQKLYANRLSRTLTTSKGPYVRISKAKAVFDKGYQPNWTSEIFKVIKSIPQSGKELYSLEDLGGVAESVLGRFYPQELQTVDYDPDAAQPIERIVKSRTVKGKKEHLVKWLDYPNSMNSWVAADSIEDI